MQKRKKSSNFHRKVNVASPGFSKYTLIEEKEPEDKAITFTVSRSVDKNIGFFEGRNGKFWLVFMLAIFGLGVGLAYLVYADRVGILKYSPL